MPTTSLPAAVELSALFEHRLAREPDAVAVTSDEGILSCIELSRAADELLAVLRAAGAVAGTRIGLELPRQASLVVAMLACLRGQFTYVPLDPAFTSDRTAYIREHAGVALMIRSEDSELRVEQASTDYRPSPESTCPLYIIYTSGSTGRPKGVPVTGLQVAALLQAALPLFDFRKSDIWALMHSYNFDFSVWEIWGALISGGVLAIPSAATLRSPAAAAEWLNAQHVTVLNQVPTVLGYLLGYLERTGHRLAAVRHLIFGGEELTDTIVRRWRALHAGTAITNMYGITEVTVHASFQRLADGQLPGGPSLIGRLLPHFEYQLVDVNANHDLGTARGELLLAGPQVGTSYLNDQQQSAERFIFREGRCWYRTGDIVEDRNGQLRYVGRVDRQVQIRGFRVELAEVEFALRNIPGVTSAKVGIERTNKDEPVLLAVVESANRSATDIRLDMMKTVPAFLVPARIEVVPEMPLSATGKASVGAR